jgi:hypothetical protein
LDHSKKINIGEDIAPTKLRVPHLENTKENQMQNNGWVIMFPSINKHSHVDKWTFFTLIVNMDETTTKHIFVHFKVTFIPTT